MTPFRTVTVGQADSARRLVAEQVPVLTHNAEARVLVSVGTTLTQPSPAEAVQAMAHYCSSRFALLKLLKKGDGEAVRRDTDYAVKMSGLWLPPSEGFLQFEAIIVPNGCLSINPDQKVTPLFLPIPKTLLGDYPWAHASGRKAVANSYGYKYLDDAIAAKGQKLVAV